AVDGIGPEAIAEVLAVEHHGAERTRRREAHVADGALGVGGLPLEVVALIEVEPRAAADRPTYLVGRMAARLGAGQSAGPRAEEAGRQARACGPGDAADWCAARSIVAAADVMRRDHDLATAQAWSTRQFCTMSGNRVFARSASLVLTPRTRLPRFVLMTPPCGVAVPKLLGSSNENVAEKPLPYCAV